MTTTREELMEADRRILHDSLRLRDWEGAFYAQQRLTLALQARLDEAERLLTELTRDGYTLREEFWGAVKAARAFLGGTPCDTPCGIPGDTVPCNVGPKGHPGNCNHFGYRRTNG